MLTIRRERAGETSFKRWRARLYYKLIRRMSETESLEESGDYRLLDRKAVDAFNGLGESHRYGGDYLHPAGVPRADECRTETTPHPHRTRGRAENECIDLTLDNLL